MDWISSHRHFRAGLIMLTGAITYFAVGAALRPLQDLGSGLTRMRKGNYDDLIPVSGPPEIRRSQ
jgi:two-component system, NarL family, sensor histidine kinase UhpB